MKYLTLNNGIEMPMVGFGTWDIRDDKGKRSILTALEAGYRLIDTAQMYDNEHIYLKKRWQRSDRWIKIIRCLDGIKEENE